VPELILERGSDLYRALAGPARERRCVFVAGLPGVGKSLVAQQLALIAVEQGREVHLLQWDVARLAFDRPEILARYPEVDGVTHAVIRAAVGVWARRAVGEWHRTHPDPRHLLLGETPLVGDRLSELTRPLDDDVEPLLASARTLFLIPAPTRALRDHLERARSRDMAAPRHERDGASAPPHLVRAEWDELACVAGRLGIEGGAGDGYDERVYTEAYRRILRHRHATVVPLTSPLPVKGSAHAVPPAVRELVPSADEVARAMSTIEARPRAEVERDVERWYEVDSIEPMQKRHVISGNEAKTADGKPAYSSAVVAGDTIYLAGAVSGRDAAGSVIGRGDIEAQTVAVFESLKATLASAGATFADLTKITVYATKLEYRATIAQVRSRYIAQPPPASTFIVVQSLADPDFLVEIEGIAALSKS
jgi:enamine deaminase RidA (YjgF/YER057c/UK114 family)